VELVVAAGVMEFRNANATAGTVNTGGGGGGGGQVVVVPITAAQAAQELSSSNTQ
jgi:hypothetical protein